METAKSTYDARSALRSYYINNSLPGLDKCIKESLKKYKSQINDFDIRPEEFYIGIELNNESATMENKNIIGSIVKDAYNKYLYTILPSIAKYSDESSIKKLLDSGLSCEYFLVGTTIKFIL